MIEEALARWPNLEAPLIDGPLCLAYEPDPDRPNAWLVNDHSLIRDRQGLIHFFGIENPTLTRTEALKLVSDQLDPSDEPFVRTLLKLMHFHLYRPGQACRIGHAVAESIAGPWVRLPAALDGSEQGRHYGAPFVLEHAGMYWMFLAEGPHEDEHATGIYVSDDLKLWTNLPDATPWRDRRVFGAADHRDPCIIRQEDGTFLQYFAGADAEGRHTVGLASSDDLRTWKGEWPCYVEALEGAPSHFGIFESPFVCARAGLYYLLVCFAHRHYYETFVVVSDDPRRFSPEHKITTLLTHAPELIEIDGTTYMSSAGIADTEPLGVVALPAPVGSAMRVRSMCHWHGDGRANHRPWGFHGQTTRSLP